MREILEAPLSELERRLFRHAIGETEQLLAASTDEAATGVGRHFRGGVRLAVEEIERMLALARRSVEERRALALRWQALGEGLASAPTALERQELMLEFLALFTEPARLAGDRRAFARHFELDAVAERYHRLVLRRQLREEILTRATGRRAAQVIRAVLEDAGDATRQIRTLLRELDLEGFLLAQAAEDQRWRNRCGALAALGEIATAIPGEMRPRLFYAAAPFAVRCALDQRQPVWVQRAALRLLPALVSTPEVESVLRRRLFEMDPRRDGDAFVRAEALRLLPEAIHSGPRLVQALHAVLVRPDPSEHVRMEAARVLGECAGLEADRALLELVLGEQRRRDPSPRVRARALEALRRRAEREPNREELVSRALARAALHDPDPLVRRVAIEDLARLARHRQARLRKYKIDPTDHIGLEALDRLSREEPDVRLKRLAQQAREDIVVTNLQARTWFESRIWPQLEALDEWSDLPVRREDIAVPDALLGRLLAHHARSDFGITVERRRRHYLFHKGDRFVLRLWRVLHEVRHPDTAKRQAHRHTTGRRIRGELRAPPGLLAELVETKVPGERVWMEHEHGWRPFLPLLDDYLSLFSWLPWRRQRRARIFSAQGVTEIRDGLPWWRAAWRHLRLSWHYARLARLRNAHPGDAVERDRSAYLRVLRDHYGFETLFFPATYTYDGRLWPLADPTLEEHFRDGAHPATLHAAARAAAEALAAGAPAARLSATSPIGAEPPVLAPLGAAEQSAAAGAPPASGPSPRATAEEGAAAEGAEMETAFSVELLLQPLREGGGLAVVAPALAPEDELALAPEEASGIDDVGETASELVLGRAGSDPGSSCAGAEAARGFDPEETQTELAPLRGAARTPAAPAAQGGRAPEPGDTAGLEITPLLPPAEPVPAGEPFATPPGAADADTTRSERELLAPGSEELAPLVSAPERALEESTLDATPPSSTLPDTTGSLAGPGADAAGRAGTTAGLLEAAEAAAGTSGVLEQTAGQLAETAGALADTADELLATGGQDRAAPDRPATAELLAETPRAPAGSGADDLEETGPADVELPRLEATAGQPLADTTGEFQHAPDQLEDTADQLEDTADQLEDTADQLEDTADQLQDTADQLQDTAEQLEDTADELPPPAGRRARR